MKTATTHNCRSARRKWLAAAIAVSLLHTACGGPQTGPKEQLRQWLATAQEAVETKARNDLIAMISPAYSDAKGHTRDDIGKLLRLYFFRQNNIRLIVSVDEIRLYGDTAAEVELTIGMAGTNDSAFGFSADAYRFEFELVKAGDDWLLFSARWGELGKELH